MHQIKLEYETRNCNTSHAQMHFNEMILKLTKKNLKYLIRQWIQ